MGRERLALSIVVPIFNEEESVVPLYRAIRAVCDSLNRSFEIIFVDDGSQDQSFSRLVQIHESDPRVKVVQFRRNYGQTAAMSAGFRAARGEVVVSMDGDLQNDPADIPSILAKLEEGYDVVCGWRKDRKDNLISRKIPSRIANWLIGKITGVPIHDNGCSLKAYRKEVIKRVAVYAELHRFIPAMSTLAGARITEIVVNHHARPFGKSKYGISRVWHVFLDLFLIKMLTGFAARPALWFGILSLLVMALGLAWLLGFLILWFGILSLPVTALGLGWLLGPLTLEISWVVFPAVAFLFFCLAGHLLVMGILGEFVVNTGDYRPARLIAGNVVKNPPVSVGF